VIAAVKTPFVLVPTLCEISRSSQTMARFRWASALRGFSRSAARCAASLPRVSLANQHGSQIAVSRSLSGISSSDFSNVSAASSNFPCLTSKAPRLFQAVGYRGFSASAFRTLASASSNRSSAPSEFAILLSATGNSGFAVHCLFVTLDGFSVYRARS
jgi:hypothetical protein